MTSTTTPSTATTRFCPECGQQLRANYRFCIRCGRLHPVQVGAPPPGEAGAPPPAPISPARAAQPQPDRVIDQPGVVAAPQHAAQPVQDPPALPPEPVRPARPAWSVPGPVVGQPRLAPQAAALEPDEPEQKSDLLGGWLFSIIGGGYALATVAVANVILWVLSFCLAAAYDWIGGSIWFIAAVLVILVFLVSLGAPVLIILGALGAIAGAIAGALVGAAIGLVCMLGYLLGSLYKPLRPLLMYPSAAGLALLLYGQLDIYRQFLQDLPFSVWIDYLNFILAAVTGLVVAWNFLARPAELSLEESAASRESTRNILGAPWRFYRRLGGWASDAYEKDKEDYVFRGALGMKSPEEQQELERKKLGVIPDFENTPEGKRQKRLEREARELKKMLDKRR